MLPSWSRSSQQRARPSKFVNPNSGMLTNIWYALSPERLVVCCRRSEKKAMTPLTPMNMFVKQKDYQDDVTQLNKKQLTMGVAQDRKREDAVNALTEQFAHYQEATKRQFKENEKKFVQQSRDITNLVQKQMVLVNQKLEDSNLMTSKQMKQVWEDIDKVKAHGVFETPVDPETVNSLVLHSLEEEKKAATERLEHVKRSLSLNLTQEMEQALETKFSALKKQSDHQQRELDSKVAESIAMCKACVAASDVQRHTMKEVRAEMTGTRYSNFLHCCLLFEFSSRILH